MRHLGREGDHLVVLYCRCYRQLPEAERSEGFFKAVNEHDIVTGRGDQDHGRTFKERRFAVFKA
jgi:hypothetical protein